MSREINEFALKRSLKAYNWYVIFTRAYFWTPIFVLYFSTVVTLKQIFLLEAIYYACVFVLEVPSGYFSDFFGRKKTLFISAFSLCVSYLLFFIGGSFSVFAMAQFFLAIGWAFASGSDTSLHYSLLSALNKESEYGHREAKLGSWGLISIAIAAVSGGLFAWLGEYRIAYALSFIFAVFAFVLVISMKDPEAENPEKEEPSHPLLQMKRVFRQLKDPTLKYLFLFVVAITVLNHIPYELYQIYINKILGSFQGKEILADMSPFILGIHTAFSMILASYFAHRAIKIGKLGGIKVTLVLLVMLQIGMIAILGISGSYIVVVLLMLRGLPGAISSPIIRAKTTHKLPATLRATFYSTQSLLGRISFALVLLLFNLIPGDGFNNSVIVGVSIGLVFLVLLMFLPIQDKR
jgi:MFS family permease